MAAVPPVHDDQVK
jgi:hypothetical protein